MFLLCIARVSIGFPQSSDEEARTMVMAVARAEEPVEHADADGERNERVLRGSEAVIQTRHENAKANYRARAAT